MGGVISRREAGVWILAFVVIASLLVMTGFTSDDPDSALYANLSARLAQGPASHWIAPEWWGYWDSEGLFREHPVGVFLIPTTLGAVGIPGVQAAYIVGVAAGLACLLLLGHLIARATSLEEGRFALVLLQLMPMAFIFRIRANHEYPMLLCLLVLLVGLDGVRRSWIWLPVPALALIGALLVKGVFVVMPLLAALVWISLNPLGARGSAWRAIAASVIGVAGMAGAAQLYEGVYIGTTGESFWRIYWARQLEPLTLAAPVADHSTFVAHAAFYVLRLLWHPAPWSVVLLIAAWRSRRSIAPTLARLSDRTRRSLIFCLTFAVLAIGMLVPASRFAERYPFSAHYAIAAAGVVIALHTWPRLRSRLSTLDRAVPALPALLWFVLMILRLGLGPLLPRISG
jgi:4-amino-4-deoxy-L-arabinose transferase-like glycosyltransferase